MRKFTILLVDDEVLALRGLEEGVSWMELGFRQPLCSLSKEDAVASLEQHPVDIVLTDIEMPGGSGLELIRWITGHQPDVHCVIYTGHAEFSYAQEALRMGVDDYLLKPIVYERLEEILSGIQKKILIKEKTRMDLPEAIEDQNQIVERVKKLILENLSADLQRDELATMVHVSPGYLGRIFKKETGVSLTDYITKKRVAMAKQLLTKTSLSITDISNRVGINYASYFTKLFKEQIGMTPQEYRQSGGIKK